MAQPGRLAGQVAWISGGASGMGEAIAEHFAGQGAAVAISDIQDERGRAVADRIAAGGGRALYVPCDVADAAQVRAAIDATASRFGGLHVLVNCAGIVHVAPLDAYSEADWDRLMGVNVKSIFLSVKHGIPHLRRSRRSYVINIGSVGSLVGQADTPAYITSKHAVLGLTRSIALDYAADGLRCNCICPGITDTPMLRFHMSKAPDPEAALAARLQRVPMGVILQPADIARAAIYFACEDSAGVTGTHLVVDAGYTVPAEWHTAGRTRFMEPS